MNVDDVIHPDLIIEYLMQWNTEKLNTLIKRR
jgi:hypothetical protein